MKRPILFLVTGLFAALFAACYVQAAFLYALPLLAAAAILIYLNRNREWTRAVIYVTAGVLLGFLAWYANLALTYRPAVRYDGSHGIMTCTVTDYPDVYERYTSVTVHTRTLSGAPIRRFKVLLYLDGDYGMLQPGDDLTAEVSLSVPESRWNFDRFRYYRAHRIYLTGSGEEAKVVHADGHSLRYLPVRLTHVCIERLYRLLPEENAAILAGLIFGDESSLPEQYVSDLRSTGLSHITAVSGMNVSFLVGLLLLLLRRKVGSVVSIPVVILFIFMTGGSASVLRAGIMQLLWLTASLINREADPMNSLFLACGLILLANPFAVADVGLWLSFAATAGLMLFAGPMLQAVMSHIRLKARLPRRILEILLSVLCTTLAAQILVLPIQVAVFGNISLISPLANLLVVPASEYAFTGGVIALLVSFFWMFPGRLLALLPRVLTSYQLAVVPTLAQVPMATVSTDNPYVLLCLVFLYLLGLSWYLMRPARKAILLCCMIVALCVTALCTVLDHELLSQVTFADTAGGQSVIVCDRDANIVVNCGGGYSSACVGVTEALHRSGTRSVSLFILTDYRTASAGNAEALLKSVRVGTMLLPSPNDESGAARRAELVEAARACGTKIADAAGHLSCTYGAVTVDAYENEEPGNDMGRLLVKLDIAGYRVLCLGSILPENVGWLLANYGVGMLDAIAAGDSYAARMVPPAALQRDADLCVFSSYAGTDREVLSRVAAYGVTALETERSGSVRIRLPRLYDLAK